MVLPHGAGWEVRNYLQQTAAVVDGDGLEVLRAADRWVTTRQLSRRVPWRHASPADRAGVVATLVEGGALLREGSAGDTADEQYVTRWAWGETAGLYHFSTMNIEYDPPDVAAQWIQQHVAECPPVALYTTNDGRSEGVALQRPDLTAEPLRLMHRRRSYRSFSRVPIKKEQIADILFAGVGITGFIVPEIREQGLLPLTMTPSGGALNPYEAYLLAYNIDQLAPGVYHYSALDHTLAPVSSSLPEVTEVLAGQEWFEGAGAVIVLVAFFERTMWKYRHFSAYRVTLLQAGHIAQNMLLTATAAGLASAPTCAISERVVSEACRVDTVVETPVYAIGLGQPGAEPTFVDPGCLLPNLRVVDSISTHQGRERT